MKTGYLQRFELTEHELNFDPDKFTLVCKKLVNGSKTWIKKLEDIRAIISVEEDSERFYLAAEIDDTSGQFYALSKNTGHTDWFIPGRAYFHKLFKDSLYIIFTDENLQFYLISVTLTDGSKRWHHIVRDDLCEYHIQDKSITLKYETGNDEVLSTTTGFII